MFSGLSVYFSVALCTFLAMEQHRYDPSTVYYFYSPLRKVLLAAVWPVWILISVITKLIRF